MVEIYYMHIHIFQSDSLYATPSIKQSYLVSNLLNKNRQLKIYANFKIHFYRKILQSQVTYFQEYMVYS
jgi:hypothetical protein